jgi:hypothetical protein
MRLRNYQRASFHDFRKLGAGQDENQTSQCLFGATFVSIAVFFWGEKDAQMMSE